MCGIVGIWKSRPARDPGEEHRILIRMRERMTHRGPDDAGAWHDDRCFLGHRRLAIVDLSSAGRQPMSNEDGTIRVVFNGEIYNHAELRRELEQRGHRYRSLTDTETILHAYEEWGLEAFHRFNGMWGVGLWDRRDPDRPLLHLIRDRIGIKPLYLTRTNQGDWLFASEIKALLAHPEVRPEMDLTALWHYLTFIVAPAPLTLFRHIFKLPAGWRVTIDATGAAQATCWWDSRPHRDHLFTAADLSEEECANLLLHKLRQAIQRRMIADVPFGVLLSGGVDSSMNVALMSELMDRPVTTFSIGYVGQEMHNEFQYARRVAQRYRTNHHEILIRSEQVYDFLPTLVEMQDEPIADNVCIPLYFLCQFVKEQGTTVVQVGEGADENWLGYWWCEYYRHKYETVYRPAAVNSSRRSFWQRWFTRQARPSFAPEDAEIVERAQRGQELFWGGAVCWWGHMRQQLTPQPERFRQELYCPVANLLPTAHGQLDSHAVVRHYVSPLDGQVPEPRVLHVLPYLERKLRLAEHLLMRVDKCSMAHAVEARVPFLDYELVEFAQRVPVEYKLRDGIGKYLLKKAARPFLDEDLIWRNKQGFGAPLEEWLRETKFNHHCRTAFERSILCREQLVNADYVRRLFDMQAAGTSWSFHLWTILNVVFWHEKWMG